MSDMDDKSTPQDGKDLLLKVIQDGISTHWKPYRTVKPFFSGGKVEFFDDGAQLACIQDMKLCFVDMKAADKAAQELQSSEGEGVVDEIVCFCVAPNGKDVVTASRNLLLRHWKIETHECVRSIKGHRMPILAMGYDSSSTLVATGCADRIVRVWDIPRGYCTHSFKQHNDIVPLVLFHPDPHRLQLFSASDDSTLRVYDLVDSKCVADFREHMSVATSVTFTEDGYTAASVGRDKVINFYDLREMSHLKTIAIMEEMESAIILPRETGLALLGEPSDARKKKRKAGAAGNLGCHVLIVGGDKGLLQFCKFTLQAHEKSSFQFEPMFMVNAASGATFPCTDVSRSHFPLKSMTYQRKTSELIVTTADNAVISFDIQSNASEKSGVSKKYQLMGSFDEILDLAVVRNTSNEDEKTILEDSETMKDFRVAVVSNSPHVQILGICAETTNLLGHGDVVLSVDCSPDGKWLVTSSKDRSCRLWSTESGQCIGLGEGHSDAVGCVAICQRQSTYSSKLAAMISGGSDKVLKRWPINPSGNITTPVRLKASHSVRAHDKDINTVAVAPNDSVIASGSLDSKIRLWKMNDLTPVATLSGHKRSIWGVTFSPVDKCLASSSGDRSVKLWSLADYSCLRTFQGHTASVLCVKFVNNGMQLMSGASDGLINLWTIRTGELQNTFDHHDDKVWTLQVASSTSTKEDSGIFISAGSDSQINFWSDCTVQEENNRIKSLEEKMLMDQKLGNDIRGKRYKEALKTALQLRYSAKALEIFRAILEDFEMTLFHKGVSFSFDEIKSVYDQYVEEWSNEDLVQVMGYVKEWNTNSRNSYMVNILLTSIVRLVGIDELVKIPALAPLLDGIAAYSERHYRRLDRLHEATYLLEFINSEMSHITNINEMEK